jgi:hypothetical protein
VNRRLPLILALGASLVCCSLARHDAVAQVGNMDNPTDPGINPPPAGDPDSPSNPGKAFGPGRATRTGTYPGKRAVGDGSLPRGAWAWRIQIAWIGFKRVYFRF